MVASFERHLKRKSYPVSIINDHAFERLRKTLHSKQKQLKKKGREGKQASCISGLNRRWNENSLWERPSRCIEPWSYFKYTMVKQQPSFWPARHKGASWYALGRREAMQNRPWWRILRVQRASNQNKNRRRSPRCESLRTKNVSANGDEKDPVAVYKVFAEKRPEKNEWFRRPVLYCSQHWNPNWLTYAGSSATPLASTNSWVLWKKCQEKRVLRKINSAITAPERRAHFTDTAVILNSIVSNI